MKFKVKEFKSTNNVIRLTTLVIISVIVLTGTINVCIQLVDHKQIAEFLSDKIYFETLIGFSSVRPQGNHVAQQENKTESTSKSDKYSTLHSSSKQNYGDGRSNSSETLLYRKRRYLQFPEGSSLQLVFNVLLPIIDYTNYAIIGITCALAYELPSKPLSELKEDLVQTIHHETNALSQKYQSNPNDKQDYQNHIKNKFSNLIYVHPSEYDYQNSYNTPDYVLDRNKHIYKNYIPTPYSPSYYGLNNPLYFTNNGLSSYYNSKNPKFDAKKRIDSVWKDSNKYKSPYIHRKDEIPKRKQPAVYHIIGKRSIPEMEPSTSTRENTFWLEKLDQYHLQLHRSSRHELYSKLEIMLNKQGKNGTQCVLRALCETGKRRHETEPGELFTEIFRAVFTLPKDDQEINYKNYHPIHKARDDAHWNQQNCSQAYPLCENFIWDGNFRV